ncbi:DNA mismatch repair endonuclease MutL [bacterium]|nr:DNA mismatch repair endonuclease MutL [bacterium]
MKRIKQLSKHVINQIAAGEVIERPYSVVKELVENSIDAGATKISIEISNECRNIRIADNGSGIHPDDIMLAFSKHATSKIQDSEDLYNINTLGFRGEALSSIISISKVTCTTRTKDFEHGTKVECENSEVKTVQTGCAIGTIMEIKDLFYNIPARLKFLKSARTEFSYIQELIQTAAIIHTDIAFTLKNEDKTVLETNGLGNTLATIKEVYSKDAVNHLKEVLKTDDIAKAKISGYVSTPDYTRSSKKGYFTYVNSRPVKCIIMQKAVDMAYKNLIEKHKYPFVVLNLELPPQDVDVNVHPTKKEVRYKNTNQIFSFIMSAVKMALQNNIEVKNEDFNENNIIGFSTTHRETVPKNTNDEFEDVFVSDLPLFEIKEVDIKTTEQAKLENQLKLEIKEEKTFSKIGRNSFDKTLEPQTKYDENIIGQYKKTYILIEKDDGLEIVDQHIAAERYIYETLKSQKTPASQILFISDILTVSPTEYELLQENADKFEKFGYKITFLKNNEITFKKIPQMLSKLNPKDLLTDILENLKGDLNGLEEKILITTSCKAAVKAGDELTMWQMQELIKNWRGCKEPYTCPHGRPISKLLKHKDIAAFFSRNK